MRDTRWAWLGMLTGVVLGLVVFAPALWLAAAVFSASNGQLQALQPRGTVWNGSARFVLSGGASSRDARVLPGRVHWQLRPQWMGMRLQLHADCCTGQPLQLAAALRRNGWTLLMADNTSEWPAQMLAGLGSPWNTLQAQGKLVLSLQGLSLESVGGMPRISGRVSLDALALSSRLSTLRPIGSYRLRLVGRGDAAPPELHLETLEGSLALAGEGRWTGKRWNFRGQASASAEDEPVLGNLLNIVGRRQGTSSIIALD